MGMVAGYNEIMNSVILDPDIKEQLQYLTKSASQYQARRARLILAYAAGMQTCQAAQTAGLSSGRARYWKREFNRMGMAIFLSQQAERGSAATHQEIPADGGVTGLVEKEIDKAPEDVSPSRKEPKKQKQRAKKDKKAAFAELAYPQPVKATGLMAKDTLAWAGKKVLLAQFAAMLQHEEGTRLGEDIESLHDMRVATRRMRAAFSVFGGVYDTKIIKPCLKGLRQTGRLLGSVRDLDVFMEKANRYLDTLPAESRSGLDPLLLAWRGQLDEARNHLNNHLNSASYETFKRSLNYFIQTPEYAVRDSPEENVNPSRVCEIAPYLIYECLARVRAYEEVVNSASITQLHALRIEFKRLRYTLEFFVETLGGEARQVIELIKKLQDHLGDMHDADVACQILNGFLENWDREQVGYQLFERKNPEPIVNYLGYQYAERHRLLVTFPEAWARFIDPQLIRKIALAISAL